MLKRKIQHLAIDPDGSLQIGYFTPEHDVKAAGVVKLHTLMVPRGFDYDDEIDAVIDALVYLVNDVEDDWDKLAALTEGQDVP